MGGAGHIRTLAFDLKFSRQRALVSPRHLERGLLNELIAARLAGEPVAKAVSGRWASDDRAAHDVNSA